MRKRLNYNRGYYKRTRSRGGAVVFACESSWKARPPKAEPGVVVCKYNSFIFIDNNCDTPARRIYTAVTAYNPSSAGKRDAETRDDNDFGGGGEVGRASVNNKYKYYFLCRIGLVKLKGILQYLAIYC